MLYNNKTAMIPEVSIVHSHARPRRWEATVLASAAIVALLGASPAVQAVALGAVTVKSSLGEPLRAEIEIPQLSPAEAANFKAVVASQQAFRAAGVEYPQALAGARVTLQHRANGQAYLRLQGDRPVREPFLSVVIQANWADGSMVRDYTMLIDPPGHAAPPPVAVTEPQAAPDNDKPVVAEIPVATQVTPGATRASAPQPAETQRPVHRTAAAAGGGDGDGKQVTVRRGDTAISIVNAHSIDGVSLDQALVALLRSNPHAFIGKNVNRMRAGAVLNMPSAGQASAIAPRDARREIVAQVRNFNAYRSSVAQNVRNIDTSSTQRSVSGEVQAQVQDNRAPASGDHLTMTAPGKGSGAKAGIETVVASAREAKAQADRIAELNKNRDELLRLKSASGKQPPATSPASSPIGITVPANASPVSPPASEPTTPPEPSADNTASANTDLPATPEDNNEASEPIPAPPPATLAPKSGFLGSLTANRSLPLLGGLVVLLLAGFGMSRWRKKSKRKTGFQTSAFTESGLQADSFFGASGGQKVNTRKSGGDSSLTYAASQLDAAGDVDPVAEADVYLAYGRDVQAEEILKEAVRTHSGRIAIHRKLAEIYAKRRDARALQGIATQAYEVTHGTGPDWQAICALGSELDPINPFYKPGGKPAARSSASAPRRRSGFGADTEAGAMTSGKLGDSELPATESTQPAKEAAARSSVDLDLDLEFTPPAEPPPILRAAPPPVPPDSKIIEYDMEDAPVDSKSRSSSESKAEPSGVENDPLGTKLALAEEFLSIGDKEGARNLFKEVAAEATDALKARAERALAELG
jgi:pilus assembly protein FimV